MTSEEDTAFFFKVCIFGYVFSAVVAVASVFIEAPYGKLATGSKMKVFKLRIPELPMNPRLGWFLMELPATLSFWFFYFQGPNWNKPIPMFLAALWGIHYGNRGFFFPYNIRVAADKQENYSLIIVLFGWVVTSIHGYLSARWYSAINLQLLDTDYMLTRPYFIIGLILYEFGFWNTIYCEYIVRNLRTNKPGEPKYKIPYGGGFQYVTNAVYFFELLGWFGIALATLNPGCLYTFLISCANLVPRAFQVHQWYLKTFDDYPKNRMVLIPFIL